MEKIEVTGKTVEEAVTNALVQLETTSDKLEYEVVDKGSAGILGIFNSKPAKILAWKKETMEDNIRKFMNDVFDAMELSVNIEMTVNDEESEIDINLSGDNTGVLIGKRGHTLDSLQYLVNLVANKNSEKYYRVKIDTENYRERRKATLEALAKSIAYKVKRTKKPVSLDPMNPYERRIIHSALQDDKYVTTKSEGEGTSRHVVVFMKK